MAFKLNVKLRDLKPYEPGNGDYKIRLDANESFLKLPEKIREEIKYEINDINFNRYPDPTAKKVCTAFANYYDIDVNCVTAFNGSDELLFLIASAFTQKGSTVVTCTPDFSMYGFYAYIAECNTVDFCKNRNLEISADAIIDFYNKNNGDVLIFSNPCNPTSRILSADEIKIIAANIDGLFVLDEAYMDFSDCSVINEVTSMDNVLMIRTCSKMIGLAGIRLGFSVANKTITNALKASKSPYNVNSITQKIGEIVLSDKDYLKSCREKIIASRDNLYSGILPVFKAEGIKVEKPNTNFIFAETEKADDIFEYLKTKGILVRTFKKYLRITAGNEEENAAVIKAVADYFKR